MATFRQLPFANNHAEHVYLALILTALRNMRPFYEVQSDVSVTQYAHCLNLYLYVDRTVMPINSMRTYINNLKHYTDSDLLLSKVRKILNPSALKVLGYEDMDAHTVYDLAVKWFKALIEAGTRVSLREITYHFVANGEIRTRQTYEVTVKW